MLTFPASTCKKNPSCSSFRNAKFLHTLLGGAKVNTLRRKLAVTILALTLAVSASAGQIQNPGAASTGTGTGTGTNTSSTTDIITTIATTLVNVIYP